MSAALVKVDPKIAETIEELKLGAIVKKSGDKCIITINNPTFNLFGLNEEALKNLSDLFFLKHMGVVREDIATEEAIVANNIKNVLKDLRPYLLGEDYGALSYASYMIKLEDKGSDVSKLRKRLFETYHGRGVRIYSLLRSGIFEKEIVVLIKEGGDRETISKHIERMITAPDAIFVSYQMEKDNIKKDIDDRFSRNVNSFQIFARATGVDIAIDAIEEVMEASGGNIVFNIDRYPLGNTDAITIDVQRFVK